MTTEADRAAMGIMPNGSKPNPDPTIATTEAVTRATAAIRDYIDGQLAVRDERLRAIDIATTLHEKTEAHNGVGGLIEEHLGRLSGVMDQKFETVKTQLTDRDTLAQRESDLNAKALAAAFAASKEAVAAALTAQKESAVQQQQANGAAIEKSERSTAETIKTNQELSATQIAALTKSLDEVKLAISRIESIKAGATESRTGLYAVVGFAATIITIGVVIAGILGTRV